jgi:hypothetical protein
MTEHERGMVKFASILTLVITLNFFAVVTGIADGFYDQLTEWMKPWLLTGPVP